jgi:hypothetical protein
MSRFTIPQEFIIPVPDNLTVQVAHYQLTAGALIREGTQKCFAGHSDEVVAKTVRIKFYHLLNGKFPLEKFKCKIIRRDQE